MVVGVTMKKKNELIIFLFSIFLVLIFLIGHVFGSSMDFLSQHVVFPDYLRNLFYSNGKIIPDFMMHIGAGQNIFNISYYGLLNPIILISYFLPFIRMIDYIVLSNIVLFVISNLLFYRFINKKFDDGLSLFLSFLFMFSGPMLFQFHRHFMFVNYMPFLILSLINIDNKKYKMVIIDLFLIIMMSFYYSIPSIIVIILYFIYVNYDCFEFKKFFKFLFYIFISILMASILLLPTFYSILSSRAGNSLLSLSLFLPNINLDNILYGGYCVGLTSICVVGFLYLMFNKDRKNIFLFIVLCVICFFPICLFLFNGGLYARGKVLIPFLPLFVYIIGIFFNNLFDKKIDINRFLVFIILSNLIILISYHYWLYYIDLIFMIVLIILYGKFNIRKVIFIPLFLFSLVYCVIYNFCENYFSRDYYNYLNDDKYISTNYRVGNLINSNDSVNINSGNYTTSIYSSNINRYYKNFYHNVFHVNNDSINDLILTDTDNVLFNRFMGVRYIYSNYDLGFPYNKKSDSLYELDSLPIGYVSSRCVNKSYFDSLSYPYNLDILSNYVVLDECDYKPSSSINEVNLDYSYELGSNSSIKDGKLYVLDDDVIIVHINDDLSNKLLFIDVLDQVEQDKNISMSINGQINLLTRKDWLYPNNNKDFHYLISGSDSLIVKVSDGVYNISNIKTYVMNYDFIDDYDSFDINVINDGIHGTIDVVNPGWFVLKIPYDDGFTIKVNGSRVSYGLVDTAFIGFYLDSGHYDISIDYSSPYLKEGIILSVAGFSLFSFLVFRRDKYED